MERSCLSHLRLRLLGADGLLPYRPPISHGSADAFRIAPVADLDDVRAIAFSVLRHRVVLNFQAEAEGVGVEKILNLK